jgi:hypothetical protein
VLPKKSLLWNFHFWAIDVAPKQVDISTFPLFTNGFERQKSRKFTFLSNRGSNTILKLRFSLFFKLSDNNNMTAVSPETFFDFIRQW